MTLYGQDKKETDLTGPTTVDTRTFNKIREIVYERCGIALRDGKEAMVSARIGKRMRALKIDSYKEYLKYLMHDASGEEGVHFLDVISTNVTSFFRESDHFDFMKARFREWTRAGQRRFRFWSAACSSGEESYSLAMTLMSTVERPGLDIRILGTDISTQALAKARTGVYPWDSMKTVPPIYREKYFQEVKDAQATKYKVKSNVKEYTVFKRLNLSVLPYPMKGPMDAVFCRNVMIYFDKELCRRLLSEIHRLLKPDGFLLTGHAESLTSMLSDFKPIQPSVYVKRN